MKKLFITILCIISLISVGIYYYHIQTRKTKLPTKQETFPKDKALKKKLNQAFCIYHKGEYNKALTEFQKILSAEPSLDEETKENIYFASGECYRKLGYPNKAIKSYQRTTTSKNKDMRMISVSLIAALQAEQGNIQKAMKTSEDLIKDKEQNKEIRMSALDNIIYLKESELKSPLSESELKKVISRYGTGEVTLPARVRLAEAYLQKEKYDEAEKMCQEIIENYPDNVWATSAKAVLLNIYARKKDYKKIRSIISSLPKEHRTAADDAQVEELIKAIEASSAEQEPN